LSALVWSLTNPTFRGRENATTEKRHENE
jgi:hypothetical protein